MLFGKNMWTQGVIAITSCDYSKGRWSMFRMSGDFDSKGKPVPESAWDADKRVWKDYSFGMSVDNVRGVFQPYEEAKAAAILDALLAFEIEAVEFKNSLMAAAERCIGEQIEPDDLRKQANFVKAVAIHLTGERDGLTDVFLDETIGPLERLAARVKLATAA